MVLRKEFNIQSHSGFGQGPSLAFNLYSAGDIAKQIAKNGVGTTAAEAAVEGAATGASRGAWWGAAAGATLGIGLVTWAWWKSRPETSAPSEPEPEVHESFVLLPDDFGCLMNPYDMSFGCMMIRLSIITTTPAKKYHPDRPAPNPRERLG